MWFGIIDKNMRNQDNLACLDVAKKMCEKKIHNISEHLKEFEPDVEINYKTLEKWENKLKTIEDRMLLILINLFPEYDNE